MNKDIVDFSLDWGDSPPDINKAEPTIAELHEAMENLRSSMRLGNYPIPYAHTLCRKEVAHTLGDILSKNDNGLIVQIKDVKPELEFDEYKNCYLKYLVIARHPKAFKKALEEISGNLITY